MSSQNWRDAYGKDQVLQRIRPESTREYLNNPHKGTATFQRFAGDPLMPTLEWPTQQLWSAPEGADAMEAQGVHAWDSPSCDTLASDSYPPSRLAYCRWAWSILEPERGRIRFDLIERALAKAAARGQALQLRTQPQVGPYQCPEWYWQLGAKADPQASSPRFNVADHNDPLYLENWGNHIRALGKRFDGHPNLESFDIGYGGGCGEGGGNSSPQTAHALVQIYLESFPRTQLLSMLGTEGCVYAFTQRGGRVGWRADCFGDVHSEGNGHVPDGLSWNHMYDMYPQEIARCGLSDVWKTSPVVFETCWAVPYWFKKGWDIDWILEQGLKYHVSVFMPKSMAIPQPWMDKIMAFNQRIGYCFHLQQMILPLEATAGSTCQMSASIDNRGIAPIYRPYRLALRFSQGHTHRVVRLQQDIRSWMPDLNWFSERFVFPTGLTRGQAEVSCGIIDSNDQPVVRLAIKAIDPDGWHPLTSIDVC